METKFPQTLYSPTSLQLENRMSHLYGRSFNQEAQAQSPLNTTSDESHLGIESAFVNMNISSDFVPYYRTPSFPGLPATQYGMPSGPPVRLPLADRENQEHLFWTWGPGDHGGTSIGSTVDQLNLNVGPHRRGFCDSGAGACFDSFNHSLKYHRQREFSDFGFDSCSCCYSHAKQPLMREQAFHSPNLLSPEQCNFDPRTLKDFCRSLSAENSGQHLYRLRQQVSMEGMRGEIASLSRDQLWSDVLKFKLKERPSDKEIEIVLSEVMESLCELMKDRFGSQFVEKLFVVCNEEQRSRIVFSLTKTPFNLIKVCLNSIGGRAMHSLLEKVNSPQQISSVISALTPAVAVLANDPNSQHVVLFFVKRFSGECDKHFSNEIADNCLKLATSKSGCCVLQLCIDNFRGNPRDRLIKKIISNAVGLSEDPYGNYVVQHLLGMRMSEVITDLLGQLRENLVYLSCNKYASNVVEKILCESGEMHSAAIIMELLASPNTSKLLVDPFGNFVIQSALKNSKEQAHDALLNMIQINAASMQSNPYGKKVLAWVDKRKLLNA